MFSETLGKIHFILTFIGFNCVFFPMHIVGAAGLPRRYAAYTGEGASKTWEHMQPYQEFMTISAIVLGLGQVFFLIALIYSAIWGKKAEKNPWKANTLEWTLDSPPPHGNFHPDLPTVYRGPYEYNSALVEEDYLPQDRELESAGAGKEEGQEDAPSGEGAA